MEGPSDRDKYSRRLRPGAVVGVDVQRRRARPVTIECHDHAHRYEFAWKQTDHGPVIIDLRITSSDETPITSDSLRRVNIDRLAATAQLVDTPEQAQTARRLREALEEATRDADPDQAVAEFAADLESRGFVTEANEMRREAAERGATTLLAESLAGWDSFRSTRDIWIAAAERVTPEVMARVRERARPGRAPREFYDDVAKWARHARTRNWPVYAYVAKQAAALWGRVDPTTDTIRRWIRRAEAEGFLKPGEIRAPRKTPKKKGTR